MMAAAAAVEAVAADSRPLLRPRLLLPPPLPPPRLCTEKKVENEKKIYFWIFSCPPLSHFCYHHRGLNRSSAQISDDLSPGMKEMCQLLYLALISSNFEASTAALLIAIYTQQQQSIKKILFYVKKKENRSTKKTHFRHRLMLNRYG